MGAERCQWGWRRRFRIQDGSGQGELVDQGGQEDGEGLGLAGERTSSVGEWGERGVASAVGLSYNRGKRGGTERGAI
jgi:hypothetical protein